MKYLLLALISLFCLSSLSDHKNYPPLTKEDRARYQELERKRNCVLFKGCIELNKEDKEEYEKLKYRKENEGFIGIHQHFSSFMHFERELEKAQKGELSYYINVFNELFSDDNLEGIPDCTKDRYKKESYREIACPKPPYAAIYWAKKYFESGHCVNSASYRLMILMDRYVVPKTYMSDDVHLFNILNYMATTVYYKYHQQRALIILKNIKAEEELERKRIESDPEYKKEHERFKAYERSQRLCARQNNCPSLKKGTEDRLTNLKNKTEELRNRLHKEDQEIADKMISDLVQKWSKKYGKENIYKCRPDKPETSDEVHADLIDFLNKRYPHH